MKCYGVVDDIFNNNVERNLPNRLRNADNTTMFMYACITNHMEVAQYLLSSHDIRMENTNIFGDTGLHWAAAYSPLILKKILPQTTKSNLNMKGRFGYTPLHEASLRNQKENVEALLFHGADVNIKDDNDQLADELCHRGIQVDSAIVEMIQQHRLK